MSILAPRAAPDAAELLRLFFLGKPDSTRTAYASDLEAFAIHVGAPSVEAATAALFSLPKHAADAVALEWQASLTGAPSTRSRRASTLRSLSKTAREYGVVDWVLSLKTPRVDVYRDTAGPGLEAVRTMIRAAESMQGRRGDRARAVLELVSTMGLRREEVAKLKIGNYNAQARKLTVEGKRGKIVIVTVPEPAALALDAWLSELQPVAAHPIIQRLNSPGSCVSGRAIYKIISEIALAAGVRTWPHGLRHTAITEVTREDGLVAASKFARHSDVKTTMIYQDNLDDVAGKAAEKFAKKVHEGHE